MAGRELTWLGGVERRTVDKSGTVAAGEGTAAISLLGLTHPGQQWQPSGGIQESVKKAVIQGPTLENGKERGEERKSNGGPFQG